MALGTIQPKRSTARRMSDSQPTRLPLQSSSGFAFIVISSGGLMQFARAGRLMVATVWLNIAAPAVHISRPRPIGEVVIRTVFFSAFWRRVENSVNAEKFFAAAAESRVGVKDLT